MAKIKRGSFFCFTVQYCITTTTSAAAAAAAAATTATELKCCSLYGYVKASSSSESLHMPDYSPVHSLLTLITSELDEDHFLSSSTLSLIGQYRCDDNTGVMTKDDEQDDNDGSDNNDSIIIFIFIIFLTPVLNSQGRKIMLCKDKIRKQAGMVFTPPPPSQNYQEVEQH